MRGEESGVELGEVSLHGDTRNCSWLYHLSRRIQVDKAKINLISGLPVLKSIRDIHSFLGHVGFYRRFIKDFSTISRPLLHLLMKDTQFEWSKEW